MWSYTKDFKNTQFTFPESSIEITNYDIKRVLYAFGIIYDHYIISCIGLRHKYIKMIKTKKHFIIQNREI